MPYKNTKIFIFFFCAYFASSLNLQATNNKKKLDHLSTDAIISVLSFFNPKDLSNLWFVNFKINNAIKNLFTHKNYQKRYQDLAFIEDKKNYFYPRKITDAVTFIHINSKNFIIKNDVLKAEDLIYFYKTYIPFLEQITIKKYRNFKATDKISFSFFNLNILRKRDEHIKNEVEKYINYLFEEKYPHLEKHKDRLLKEWEISKKITDKTFFKNGLKNFFQDSWLACSKEPEDFKKEKRASYKKLKAIFSDDIRIQRIITENKEHSDNKEFEEYSWDTLWDKMYGNSKAINRTVNEPTAYLFHNRMLKKSQFSYSQNIFKFFQGNFSKEEFNTKIIRHQKKMAYLNIISFIEYIALSSYLPTLYSQYLYSIDDFFENNKENKTSELIEKIYKEQKKGDEGFLIMRELIEKENPIDNADNFENKELKRLYLLKDFIYKDEI